jgi:hypothetical protein
MIVREADTARAQARRSARSTHHLLSSPQALLGVRRVECVTGPCCGERWVANHPCAPVVGGEDGALARRPQAPLEVVEKFLTSNAETLARSS